MLLPDHLSDECPNQDVYQRRSPARARTSYLTAHHKAPLSALLRESYYISLKPYTYCDLQELSFITRFALTSALPKVSTVADFVTKVLS